jgi:CRP-like cAMP-binding protein
MAITQHPFVAPLAELTDVVLNYLSSFYPLSEEVRESIRKKFYDVRVKKNEYLLRQGETSGFLYLIIKGLIVGYTERKGRKLTTYICSDGDSVSSISGMYGMGPSDESMLAVEDTHLIGLPVSDLLHYLETSFAMNVIIRKVLEDSYKMAHERSNLVRVGTAQEKYGHYLSTSLWYVDRIPSVYIADFLGIKPKKLQKLLNERKEVQRFSSILHQQQLIEDYMVKTQAFKRHGLTLSIMAADLAIPVHQLSLILNAYYKKGFNTFINGHRISYIKDKLQNNFEWQHLKIEALGLEGGFSSRSAFFSEFRAQVGLSPAEYARSFTKIAPEQIWLTVNKVYKKCPHCKDGELDIRVKRSKLVKFFLFFLPLKRYACSSCERKVYLLN